MRIAQLKVDGFGVWSGLELEEISDRINVVFGPNESGKTTLLQFVRSVLYGFAHPRRRRYLPPVAGGDAGGVLIAVDRDQQYEVARHDLPGEDDTQGTLRIIAPDGTLLDERQLNTLLGGVDEATFNNVFAVGLRELQELGTLNDSDAAALLYRLATGLDRVSLGDVIRDLRASRDRLLAVDGHAGLPAADGHPGLPSADGHPGLPAADGRSGQVSRLLAQRATLQREIDQLRALTEEYSNLALHRQRLHHDIRDAEDRAAAAEREARVVEVAAALDETWRERVELEKRLAGFSQLAAIPDDALRGLEELRQQIESRKQRLEKIQAQRADIKRQAAASRVNRSLWRQAPRIHAMVHQQQWAAVLEKELEQSSGEVADLENELNGYRRRLGLDTDGETVAAVELSRRSIKSLKMPARQLRETQDRWAEARRKKERAERNASQLQSEIRSALADRAESDLTAALESAGNAVSQLRRVMQLDQRVESLREQEEELRDQNRQSLAGQMLPGWVLVALGAVFVCGVILLLSGLLLPTAITGAVGWPLAVLGLGGAAGTVVIKFSLERTAVRRWDATAKQLELAQAQLKQAGEERDALAARVPKNGGPLSVRLQAAEAELAELEELMGLEGRRQVAEKEAQAANQQLRGAEDERRQARKNWRRALRRVGIHANLLPRQVRRLQSNRAELDDLQRRLASRREEHNARRSQLESLRQSAGELAAEAGLKLNGATISERIDALSQALDEQESIHAGREQLRRRWRKCRRREADVARRLDQARDQRRRLLARYHVADEQEFLRLAETCRQRADILHQRDQIDQRIQAAVGGNCTTEEVVDLLAAESSPDFEQRYEALLATVSTARDELKQLYQRRGEGNEQLATLAADRRLPAKQLELGAVQQQLREAVGRWLVLAVTAKVLDEVRVLYQRERQPETLRRASEYLERLTEGHYTRVWTPLDEDVLLVDDDAGRSLPVELLSRGTREQVFLSLRLALVATYARRGVDLPLVLDDVLVNFDAGRAKAAARVLRDFAAAGHQVLLFTCHEHIMKLFKSLKVSVIRLPANATTVEAKQEDEPAPKVVEMVAEPPPAEEPLTKIEDDEPVEEDDDVVEYNEEEGEKYEYDEVEEEEEEYEDDEYEDDEIEEVPEAPIAADDEDEYESEEVEYEAYAAGDDDGEYDVDALEDEIYEDEQTIEAEQPRKATKRDDRFTWEDRTHLEETAAEDDGHPDAEAA